MAVLRVIALVLMLAVPALLTAGPMALLWLAVPVATGTTLLLAWRFGGWGALTPVVLLAGGAAFAGAEAWWLWWIPAGAVCGAWMGLREERAAFTGGRAWMLAPALALAAGLVFVPGYRIAIARLDAEIHRSWDPQFARDMERMSKDPSSAWMVRQWLQVPDVTPAALQQWLTEISDLRRRALPNLMPSLLFVWVAVLIAADRSLAGRLTTTFGWPPLSRMRFAEWRLPDGAIWTFLAGMGLLLAPLPAMAATGWTLLLNAGLGFCFQGIAIVESLMLARGIPLPVVVLTLAFVFLIAWPLFVMTTAVLGLSDVWLDYRRLEASPDGDAE
jgi:hypothetical protein